MKIRQVSLPIDAFLKIPKDERALLVAMGHALNEYNIFNKLLIASSHFADEPLQVAYAQSIQMYSIARVLVGKIYESWNVINSGFFKSHLSKKYSNKLNNSESSAINGLKKYFSKKNLIEEVRNGLAFHFSIASAATAPLDELNKHDLSIYLSESQGNCIYPFSETIFNTEMMRLTGCPTMQEAFMKLVEEINAVDRFLNTFAQGIMALILAEHIGNSQLQAATEQIEIGEVTRLREITIPFFCQGKNDA